MAAPTSIDAYLASLPVPRRTIAEEIRQRVAAASPDAIEGIKYGMPTAAIGGEAILYYAVWKTHVGLYPVYRGSTAFEAAVAPYRDKKDMVRFPLSRPLPYEIVDLILDARINALRAAAGGRCVSAEQ